jgi:hypothetical protein
MSVVNDRHRGLATAALTALTLGTPNAFAQDAGAGIFSFSGFGTIGVVHSSERLADFTGDPTKPRGAGYSSAWSFEPDSLLGVQVAARFTERFSAVVQVVSEQDPGHTYRPEVEWANVKYQATPDFSVRIGRTVLPVLMLADIRRVGYANPWVRPPVEVYSLVPVTSNNGVDASYHMRAGAASNTLQITVGQEDSEFEGGVTSQARDIVILVNTFEYANATVRAEVGRARITIPALAPLFDGFRQFGPEGVALADKYEMKDRPVDFLAIGASYDPGGWFAMGEWGRVSGGGILGTKSSWYVSGGYRWGKLTPYATYARANADNLHDPGLTLAGLPPYLADPANALNAGLNASLGAKIVQQTLSVGARWDFAKNAAAKLQYDHTRVDAASLGLFANIQPGFERGGRVNLFSATLDFIFR